MCVVSLQFFIILITKIKPCNRSFHQRCCCSNCKEIMYFLNPVHNHRRSNYIPKSPSRYGIGFRKRITYYGPLPHSRQSRNICMFIRFIKNMLIHFVSNNIYVIFLCKVCNNYKFISCKYFSTWI